MNKHEIKKVVKQGYAAIASKGGSCCGPSGSCCTPDAVSVSRKLGYTEEEMNAVPEGANLGLGCGNPVAFAELKQGETVLDLGSGPGLDCFLAAGKVGRGGKVIGVDMTSEMIEKARENAEKGDYNNVEFRLGEIENLPVDDNSVDVVISNCVINLSTDKQRVFNEIFRVLKPGGRMLVSDIVLSKELPESLKNSDAGYIGCISGAVLKDNYMEMVESAGFRRIEILDESSMPVEGWVTEPVIKKAAEEFKMTSEKIPETACSVLSIKVRGTK